MKITVIYGSPRKNGNTDLLLQACVRGLREAGADPHEIVLRDLTFSPCTGCNSCEKTGVCVLKDDMQIVYPHLVESEIVVLAAPVFFYGLNALAKAMVDRSQALWMRKYRLNEPASRMRGCKGRGILLSVGGAKGKKNFDGILLTARYFFDALDMDFYDQRLFNAIDQKGAVKKHPEALNDGYVLGKKLVESS